MQRTVTRRRGEGLDGLGAPSAPVEMRRWTPRRTFLTPGWQRDRADADGFPVWCTEGNGRPGRGPRHGMVARLTALDTGRSARIKVEGFDGVADASAWQPGAAVTRLVLTHSAERRGIVSPTHAPAHRLDSRPSAGIPSKTRSRRGTWAYRRRRGPTRGACRPAAPVPWTKDVRTGSTDGRRAPVDRGPVGGCRQTAADAVPAGTLERVLLPTVREAPAEQRLRPSVAAAPPYEVTQRKCRTAKATPTAPHTRRTAN
jgi:hypothetical protein